MPILAPARRPVKRRQLDLFPALKPLRLTLARRPNLATYDPLWVFSFVAPTVQEWAAHLAEGGRQ